MNKQNDILGIKIETDLKQKFIAACNANLDTKSHVLRELVQAYIELTERAKGRRLPRLDLCGYEKPCTEVEKGDRRKAC